jgi:hypothetical protein
LGLTEAAAIAILRFAILLQFPPEGMMAVTKTATLALRIDPHLKEALRNAAQQERRSIANMAEVMILTYCEQQSHVISGANAKNREERAE